MPQTKLKGVPTFLVGTKGGKRPSKCKSYDYNGFEKQYHVKENIKKLPPLDKSKYAKKGRIIHSRFKKEYISGHLPFEVDYSAHAVKIKRLAWKEDIQEIDLREFLPVIIGGLSDCNIRYVQLADLAISELMTHATRYQVYNSLPFVIQSLKDAFHSKKKSNCMLALKTLRNIVTSLHLAGSILAVRYEELLQPLNCKIDKLNSADDNIFYGQWKSEKLEDFIIATLNILERYTDDLVDQVDVYGKIKASIPTYESIETSKLAANMIRMRMAQFQDQNPTEFAKFSKQRKAGKFSLKKAAKSETNLFLESVLPKVQIYSSNGVKDQNTMLQGQFQAPPPRENIGHKTPKQSNRDKYSLLELSRWPKYCPQDKSYRGHYRNIEKNIQRCPHLFTVKPLSKMKDRGPRYNIRLVDVKFL